MFLVSHVKELYDPNRYMVLPGQIFRYAQIWGNSTDFRKEVFTL